MPCRVASLSRPRMLCCGHGSITLDKHAMAKTIAVTRTISDLRSAVAAWRQRGERVALVPTMGALHAGHVSLVEIGRRHAARTVVSIFVNPAQFAPHEDFDKYPRTWDADLAALTAAQADLVWAPTRDVMYPAGFASTVTVAGPAQGLETEFRPHFFAGVATVCCKLFTQVAPDVAIFGEKDFQQLAVVRRMARDLDLPLEVIGAPTVRETDGLAMSSRNRYLAPAERAKAPELSRVLNAIAITAEAGGDVTAAIRDGAAHLVAAGFRKVDYLAVRDAETLGDWSRTSGRAGRVLGAAWLGETRLIDNVAV
jgi:pantoate--beta-alanine ligase